MNEIRLGNYIYLKGQIVKINHVSHDGKNFMGNDINSSNTKSSWGNLNDSIGIEISKNKSLLPLLKLTTVDETSFLSAFFHCNKNDVNVYVVEEDNCTWSLAFQLNDKEIEPYITGIRHLHDLQNKLNEI